ncbi:acetyl-CoA carboxylase biotin carboxylase subunit [Nesterenkonia flava]|uniref:biotin carboxylase n=1 Tax=Nesterenkonia flava TaxID=469799 RepID=A0ABU1FU96_9MICC|nr:acetyl-CoA carboxylase biotin carboxylase subunit [Nesterenkonia flava]MDR5712236.1 acetyl-CoA carboxylase biotin carboxylase subunit [Nesterenkonia flava]
MQKLLIANRGEIAVRIIRTARRMGIATVAVCSEADADSLAVAEADEHVVIGPAPAPKSYLNQEAVLLAAAETHADAVHPGFGFLSENASFAQAVTEAGLVWVGPSAETIRLMGDKVAARAAAAQAGVPTLAGSEGPLDPDDDPLGLARRTGFPVVIKAAAGGGGRGIRVVEKESEFLSALDITRAEARASFGDDTVYLERFVPKARHVEVQLLGDGIRVVHLGDRDCSMQRRSQKVMEEAPAPGLPDHVRRTIAESSVRLAEACGYTGAGTVEFLYDPEREEAAFIEMNTRLQVEHPVTEEITGIDIVEHQLRVAAGEPLALEQESIRLSGHAFECRINAEDPSNGFFPSPGTISELRWPQSEAVRVDSGVTAGSVVAPFYDSMVAKLIVSGPDRESALERLRAALNGIVVEGISTTVPLHQALASLPELAEVAHHTKFIEDSGILTALEAS